MNSFENRVRESLGRSSVSQIQDVTEGSWPEESVFRRSVVLGRIYAIEVPAFPGHPADWRWLVDDLGPARSSWIMRNGMSARQSNSEFLEFLIPHYGDEGKSYLTVAIGCTGGRHRSVALAERLGRHLLGRDLPTTVSHRDVGRG